MAGGLGLATKVGDVAVDPQLCRATAVDTFMRIAVFNQNQRLIGIERISDTQICTLANGVALVDVVAAGDAHAV